MALKIRLRQQGRKNCRAYRIVVIDNNTKRDGKYVEAVGTYDPYAEETEKKITLVADRVQHWVELGAQMSDRVKSLVAQVAPEIIRAETQKAVAHLEKAHAKRKARKTAAAA